MEGMSMGNGERVSAASVRGACSVASRYHQPMFNQPILSAHTISPYYQPISNQARQHHTCLTSQHEGQPQVERLFNTKACMVLSLDMSQMCCMCVTELCSLHRLHSTQADLTMLALEQALQTKPKTVTVEQTIWSNLKMLMLG